MNQYLAGGLIVSLLLNVFTIYLLYKKPTTENNIERLKQKNKRNKGSNIDNQITASVSSEDKKPRKRRLKNLLTKIKK